MLGYRVVTMTASETLAAKSVDVAPSWEVGAALAQSTGDHGLQVGLWLGPADAVHATRDALFHIALDVEGRRLF